MNKKLIFSVVCSSAIAGLIFWFITFFEYLWDSIINGNPPFDAVFMIIPIVIFSLGPGIVVCMTLYLLLKRYQLMSSYALLLISTVVAVLFFKYMSKNLTLEYSDYIAPTISGLFAGLIFLFLNKDKE